MLPTISTKFPGSMILLMCIGLIQVKEEGWTGFSKGWQGCSEGFPEGEARGKSREAALPAREAALPARGKPRPSRLFYLDLHSI